MKVLYIINYANLYGSNIALLNILDEMRPRGVEPVVVVGEHGAFCDELEKRNIPYATVRHFFAVYPGCRSSRDLLLFVPRLFRALLINLFAARKLEKLARKFNADIIHTNIGPSHIGHTVAKRLGLPHIWHIREYQGLGFDMHPIPAKADFMRKLRSTGTYPVAITSEIFHHFNMGKNARVIYDGVAGKNQTQFLDNKKNYFLFVGRLEESKGIVQLLRAFAEFSINHEDYELLVAGDGVEAFVSDLRRMAKESGLSNRINFLGFRRDVYDLMAMATALIVPSFREGFGFITVEAMFNGCLVIGNNSGGTREILMKDNLGILYSGHSELVAAMKTIASSGIERCYPTIKKAQECAVTLYSKERNAEEIHHLYTEIVASFRSRV